VGLSARVSRPRHRHQKIYNHHIPQKNLGHITPVQAFKSWQKKTGIIQKESL